MKIFYLFCLGMMLSFSLTAQKAPISELELQPDGNYYQINHQKPFSGTAEEDYPSGRKKSRAEFKNGKLDGKVTRFHEKTKEKESVVNYQKGIRVGTETHWYPSGAKKLEIRYVDGKPEGICKEWYENEKLKSEGNYIAGVEDGLHQWYYLNGKLDQTVEYLDGRANGKVKHYFPTGKLKLDADYKDGRQEGKVVIYFENGKRKSVTDYTDGLENGKDLQFSKKGLLLEEREYDKGNEISFKNYRSGALKTKKGFIQVFNEKESYFTINLDKGWIRPRQSREITYVIDDFVLQLFNQPVADFARGTGLSDEEILEKHLAEEKAFIEKGTQTSINIEKRFDSTKGKKTIMVWSFDSPNQTTNATSRKVVVKEQYLTMVCNKQVLTFYVPQTKGNDESEIKSMMKYFAGNVEVKEDKVDMNELRKSIRENAGLPPLPANETVKGYKKDGEE